MNENIRNIYYFIVLLLQKPKLLMRKSTVELSSRVKSNCTLVRTQVGKYCFIGSESLLVDTVVGNYCSIASGVKVGGMEHSWWWASTSPFLSDSNISKVSTIIEDDVWLGVNAVIRQGVTVGRGAVIGAGSIVLKDVKPYSIVAGVPSKLIRMRFSSDVIFDVESTEFWKDSPTKAKIKLRALNMSNDLK